MSAVVTIVGAGSVGTNLAIRLSAVGYSVRFAARDLESDKVRNARTKVQAEVVTLDAAAAGTDFIILAVPYSAVLDTLAAIGPVGSAVLVDATNAVGVELPDHATSVLDVIASRYDGAALVKAFNTIGAEAILDPIIAGTARFLPIAGDQEAAERVGRMASDMGFDALIIGGRSEAVLLEQFARMWMHLAFRAGLGRSFGFGRLPS